jgi:acyl-CoA thioesterase-2
MTALKALVELFDLEEIEQNLFRGRSPQERSQRVFGGQVVGQALVAATRTVEGRIAHSVKGDFLRPGDPKTPIIYEVDRIRDGKSFTTRRVVAIQHGKAIFSMSVSFQVEETGLEHQLPMPSAPAPETLPDPDEFRLEALARAPEEYKHWYQGDQPFEQHVIDHVDPWAPEKREPHMRSWLRASGPLSDNLPDDLPDNLPDDLALHQCLLAYASDMNLLDTCILPHAISWMNPKFQSASLDHSIWFHDEFRIDEWLLFVQDGPKASGGRGFNRGLVYTQDGRLIASVVQEGLIRIYS